MRIRYRAVALAAAAGLAALTGCAGSEAAPSTPAAVRDSAGVAIVENASPAWGARPAWRVAARPVLDLGGVAGDSALDFGGIAGAVRLADGRIAVADSGARQLRLFDASGRLLRTVGGRSRHARPLGAIRWLQRHAGDSLALYDHGGRRIVVLDRNGSVGRVQDLPPLGDSVGPSYPLGVLADGAALLASLPTLRGATASGPHRERTPWFRVPPGGTPARIGDFWADELYLEFRAGRVAATSRPFGRRTQAAVGGDRFVVGAGDAYALDVYASDGALVRSLRRTAPPRLVTAADVDTFVRRRLVGVEDVRTRGLQERFWRGVAYPDTMPPFGSLVVGQDRHLWVERPPALNAEAPERDVFTPEGQWLGTVVLPPAFVLLDAGPDYLLGRWADADGIEHLRLYRLEH